MSSYSEELMERQNADGGWSYGRAGGSWTEPTCFALLALAADGLEASSAARQGAHWLAARQRSDGGWAPRDAVDESTWVTALALLLPSQLAPGMDSGRVAAWLLDQTGRESGFVYRLRMRLLGLESDPAQRFDGWPWFPGAAAWVVPTALTILALEKFNRTAQQAHIRERIEEGRAFLLARHCRDGGWNHGSTHALGYDSDSYPETTGIAVLALHSVEAPEMARGVEVAERHLQHCASLEAASWLSLALLARGRKPASAPLTPPRHGTTEIAIAGLAQAAAGGKNLFVI